MRKLVKDLILPVVVAITLAFVIQASLAKPYEIPTNSMFPAIQGANSTGDRAPDRVIANRVIYKLRDISRGDIVVFDPTKGARAACSEPGDVPFVKRVIGLPGDTVELRNNQLFINGEPIAREPIETPQGAKTFYAYSRETMSSGPHYATGYSGRDPDFGPITVREGNFFAMGDNRDNSSDGRCWGQVPQDNIKGKALFIFFSSESGAGVRTERIFQSVD
jgi:signal peptidase I